MRLRLNNTWLEIRFDDGKRLGVESGHTGLGHELVWGLGVYATNIEHAKASS